MRSWVTKMPFPEQMKRLYSVHKQRILLQEALTHIHLPLLPLLLGRGPGTLPSGHGGFIPLPQRSSSFPPSGPVIQMCSSVWRLSYPLDTQWTPTFEADVSSSPRKTSLTTVKPHPPLTSCIYLLCDAYQMLFLLRYLVELSDFISRPLSISTYKHREYVRIQFKT